MPSPTTPSHSPSSSKRMLALVGGVLALVAVIWLAFGRGERGARDGGDEGAKPVANEEERPRAPGGKAIEIAPTRASGQVRATTGEPLAGAVVTLASFDQDAGEPHTVQTNDEGAWTLTGLDPGRYALSASAVGYLASVRSEVALRAGNDNAGLDLSLEKGGNTLSGVVSDKTGGVVEGALVQVTPQSGVLRLRERDSYFTLTDDQGRYSVNVPDGRHRVRASHVDYTAESLVLEFTGLARKQDFTLIPTAVIEGVVLRESDGAPVANAEVSWSGERIIFLPDGGRINTVDRGGRAVADEAGRFRISGLPPGLVMLGGRASMLASVDPLQIPVGIAERVTGIELRLADAADLEGRVVAADGDGSEGAGIEGAQVELMSRMNGARGGGGGGDAGAQTDARGQFVIRGVLPGQYRVMASAEGWSGDEDAMPRVEIGGQPTSVVIELERGLSIHGRVEPAGQAEVAIELRPESMSMRGGGMRMLASAGPTQAAADTGAFEIGPVQPGRYTLEARTADGRGGTVEVEVGSDGAEGVVINLAQRAILAGRVEDFNGKLLDDVSVRARKRKTDGGSMSVVVNGQELTALSSPTSTDGRFEIAGLAAGGWTIEVVDAQGDLLPIESGQPFELELADGDKKDIVLRVEPRDGTISGVVRDAEGLPVADAWVSAAFVPEREKPEQRPGGEGHGPEVRAEMRMTMITDDGSASASTLPPVLTDEAGKFAFTQLRRGSYTLTAELGGGVSKATLEGVRPDADVTLDLAPLGAIEGSVISNGGPASCMARIIGPSPRSVRVREGKFEVTRLEPGRYTVEVNVPDGSDSASVVVEPGVTATVDLALERFAKITGKVVDESGAPIAKAEVMIGAGEGGRVEITREHGDAQIFTQDDGTFEAHAAAGGRVLLVHVEGEPMPIVIKPFVVESGEDLDLGELRKKKMDGTMMMGGPAGEGGP
jgi:hypothetical protein